MPNYTNSQLRAELSASQRSAYTFYETEQLWTKFSASLRSAKTPGNYEQNLLHRHVVPNYTNSQLHAELSASQRSAYTFYETEPQTEFSASSRSAKSHYILRNIHGF